MIIGSGVFTVRALKLQFLREGVWCEAGNGKVKNLRVPSVVNLGGIDAGDAADFQKFHGYVTPGTPLF
jgi:hypothetical protein